MKIYTYIDILNFMNKADGIWDKIKDVPHICASEVLVQGLIKRYKRDTFDCLLTVDEFMKNLFPNWIEDNEKEMSRYQNICDLIKEDISEADIKKDKEKEQILRSFSKNPKEVMEAVKYLIESENEEKVNTKQGIKYQFDGVNGNRSIEKIFIEEIANKVLQNRSTKKDWEAWVPDWDRDNAVMRPMLDVFRSCVIDEIRKIYKSEIEINLHGTKEEKEKNAITWFRAYRENVNEWNLKTLNRLFDRYIEHAKINNLPNMVVLHGLYRMKPIHFKMISVLEDNGIEVVLLNCYNPKYQKVFKHWEKLYEMLLDKSSPYKVTEIKIGKEMDASFTPSEIGVEYGELLEGNHKKISELENNIDIEFVEYDTSIDFINSVFSGFENAKKMIIKDNEDIENINYQEIIANMEEQYYGVNGTDLNQIFMIFYPELFKKKSFMSYPAGQFLYYIHDMWDDEKQQLILKHKSLVECLNMFNSNAAEVYEKIRTYIGLERKINGLLIKDVIDKIKDLKEIYNDYKENNIQCFGYVLNQKEYETLEDALNDLNVFADKVFKNARDSKLNQYYNKLLNQIEIFNKYKNWKTLSDNEQELIKSIKNRLKDDESTTKVSSIQIVKEGIDFYLGGHSGKDINWLVRDFEQIEGDLLLFGQNKEEAYSNAKIIHYALVSNENMLDGKGDMLPWPLGRDMIVNTWLYNVLYSINEEDINYKAAMLFNGLYYLRPYSKNGKIKVRISYIINNVKLSNEENKHNEYFIMKNLRESFGLRTNKPVKDRATWKESLKRLDDGDENFMISDAGTRVFSLCPYKYFYSVALGKNPYEYGNNNFQLKRLYQEFIRDIIRNCEDKEDEKKLKEKLIDMSKKIMSDIILEKEMNEIIAFELKQQKRAKAFYFYPDLKYFWASQVKEQEKPENYPKEDKPWYYRVYKNERFIKDTILENKDGFTNNKEEYMISEYICDNCSQRGMCLYPYRLGTKHLLRKEK